MKVGIAVLSEAQKQEILSKPTNRDIVLQWVGSTRELLQVSDADFWIDCTYSGNAISVYEKPTLLHSPGLTLASIHAGIKLGRFCAWNTFLSRELWEISVGTDEDKIWISTLMRSLGWNYLFVKDEPGLIVPRILTAIINEAYHTLQAGISTREEIDIAMRLGTNYLYGPLEWSEKIGLKQVKDLLEILALEDDLYKPAFSV